MRSRRPTSAIATGTGLADGLETVLGTSPDNEDSNDDGVDDRQELTEA